LLQDVPRQGQHAPDRHREDADDEEPTEQELALLEEGVDAPYEE